MGSFFRFTRSKITLFILSIFMISNLYASENLPLQSNNSSFEESKNSLWNKYLKDVQALSELKSEYGSRALKFKDKTMRFSLEKRGVAPVGGYPLYIALHGGGNAPPQLNDSQWKAMQTYYRDSVKEGIYVATRGITNNWKLHFEDESYPLYDKLIESAILFDNVNPNRVYLMGFSAGGDGVYQITPRMPERFAAANMSAGHHNWIPFDNLYNTPFLMQVGELDSAFKRNQVAAENYIALNNLNSKYSGGFIHHLFIHYNGSHNSWRDNDASRKNHTIIADPIKWLESKNRETTSINSNAVDWLNQFTRNAVPKKLVWDLSVGTTDRIYQTGQALVGKNGYEVKTLAQPRSLFYWLDVSVAETYPTTGKLVVEVLKSANTIKILEVKNVNKFRILLNPNLLDLSTPIRIEVGDKLVGTITVKEEREIMLRTLLERSDINEIYNAEITLAYNQETQTWEIAK